MVVNASAKGREEGSMVPGEKRGKIGKREVDGSRQDRATEQAIST